MLVFSAQLPNGIEFQETPRPISLLGPSLSTRQKKIFSTYLFGKKIDRPSQPPKIHVFGPKNVKFLPT
jgi:hypothetical protein